MPVIVQKFGGTSVANLERIENVASKVAAARAKGDKVCVVLSAMAGTTDQLVAWSNEAAGQSALIIDAAEYDRVVSTGEQITIGLLALKLQCMGIKARSFSGAQLGVKTSDVHGNAKILTIDHHSILKWLNQDGVAIVPGFQGSSSQGRITTLGRGGSDTSAMAMAAALGADRCDIYTDVEGVFTTDPRITSKAQKIDRITYEEMLELASQGAKVMQTRSVALAMNHNVPFRVLSSFSEGSGTIVCSEEEDMEQNVVTGIAYTRNEARITVVEIPDKPGVAASLFGILASADINVDMIIQSVSRDGKRSTITFTVGQPDKQKAIGVLEGVKDELGFNRIDSDTEIAKISVIGLGMRSHTGVAHTMFKALADKGINIHAISTSEIKVSVLVSEEYTELAVRTLHSAYGLDASEDASDQGEQSA